MPLNISKVEAFKKSLENVKTIFKDHKLGYRVDELFDIYFKIKSACHVISKKMDYKKNPRLITRLLR